MFDMADAFIALPGGLGTLDELCEIFAWATLSIHNKPIGVINIDGYYDKFFELLDTFVEKGFMKETNKNEIIIRGARKRTPRFRSLAFSPQTALEKKAKRRASEKAKAAGEQGG